MYHTNPGDPVYHLVNKCIFPPGKHVNLISFSCQFPGNFCNVNVLSSCVHSHCRKGRRVIADKCYSFHSLDPYCLKCFSAQWMCLMRMNLIGKITQLSHHINKSLKV